MINSVRQVALDKWFPQAWRAADCRGPGRADSHGGGIRELPVSVKRTFLLREPWPNNPAAKKTALRPLIWYSERLSSHVSSSPEVLVSDIGIICDECVACQIAAQHRECGCVQKSEKSVKERA